MSLAVSLVAGLAMPLLAQGAAVVVMPSGSYVIQARDSSKSDSVGMVGWPLVLKGNGNFEIMTQPDSLTLDGKLTQKGGLATLSEQTCGDAIGIYFVRKERGGYAFDAKTEACEGRANAWSRLLFVPGKPGKP